MFSLMYLQDSKLFRFCQVRNEDIDMSYVALFFTRGLNNKLNTVSKLSICLANFY